MQPVINITARRGDFFSILTQTEKSQLGVMTIPPGSDSGPEDIHRGDQIVYVIGGEAAVEIEHENTLVPAGAAIIIPAGSQHHIYNRGQSELFFLTIYTPPSY